MSTRTDDFETDAREHRAALRGDLDAIFDRLSPGQIVEEALGQMGGVKTLTANLGAQIRDHPMPVIVTAAGLAWLIMSGRSDKSHGADTSSLGMHTNPAAANGGFGYVAVDPDDYDADFAARRIEIAEAACVRLESEQDDDYENRLAECRAHVLELKRAEGETDTGFRQRVSDTAKSARHKASDARHRITDGAAKARKGIGHAAGSAMHGAQHAAGSVKHGAQDATHAVMDGARSGMHSAKDLHENSPLATGALALAAGALIGALLPLTRQEESAFAEPADKASAAVAGAAKKAADATHDAREEIGAQRGESSSDSGGDPNGDARSASSASVSVAPPPVTTP